MTQEQQTAYDKCQAIMADRAKWKAETDAQEAYYARQGTPTLDAVEKLQKHMTEIQGILCDLGVKDRMSLTLGDITELLRMCRDIPG